MAIFEIQGPDGKIYEVDAPTMEAAASAFAPQPAQGSSAPVTANQAVRGVARGTLFGSFLDELNAATNATLDPIVPNWMASDIPGKNWSERYNASLAMQRGMDKEFDEAHPALSPALQIAGGISNAAGLLRQAPKTARVILGTGGKTMGQKVAGSAIAGGAASAVHGFGQGEGGLDNRLASGGQGLVLGSAVGAAAPAVANVIGKTAAKVVGRGPAPVPTVDQLASRANANYTMANNAGVNIAQPSFWQFTANLRNQMGRMNPKLYPKATGILEVMDEAAANPNGVTLEEADQLRQIAGDVLSSPEKGERRLAHVAIDALDDYIEKLKPSDVVGGTDPRTATTLLSQARDLWARKSKGSEIQRLMNRAWDKKGNFTASGYENALRREFRSFLSNERAMRRYSKADQEMLRNVANGGPIGNAFRWMGKFAPTGVVSSLPIALAGEPATGALIAGAGLAGRGAATMATMRNARLASEFARRGGPEVMSPDAQRIAQISRVLLQGGNPTVANQPELAYRPLPAFSR